MKRMVVVLLGIVMSLSCFGSVVSARDFTAEEQKIIDEVTIYTDKESDEEKEELKEEMLGYYKYLEKELERKYSSIDYSVTGYNSDEMSDGVFFVKDNSNDEVYTATVTIPDGGSEVYTEKDCFYNYIFKDKIEEKYDDIFKDVTGYAGTRCVFTEETGYITEESKLSDVESLSKDVFIYCIDNGKTVKELSEEVKEALGNDLPGRYNVFLISDIDTKDANESISQYLWFNSKIIDRDRFEIGWDLQEPR